jgi:hypothetical protein
MGHTYAILDVSAETFREIQLKLEAAGYQHAFTEDLDGQLVIDLHGVALRDEEGDEGPAPYELSLLVQVPVRSAA